MQPRSKPEASRLNLFQAQLKQILNLDHPLCVLAQKIDWSRLVGGITECDCPDFGAPAKGIQLMVGMYYLKHAFNESDELLVRRWVERRWLPARNRVQVNAAVFRIGLQAILKECTDFAR